jgi:hypothetical protein
MGDLASRLLARALRADEPPSPPPAFDWVSRDLGTPTVDLEDKEALNWKIYQATRIAADRGNDIPDGHLATLMRQHGVATIYTRDRDFRRFDGIAAQDPFE